MNRSMYRFSLRKNLLFIFWFAVGIASTIAAYMMLFPSVVKGNAYADLLDSIPQDMLSAIGMVGNISNLNDYLNMNFYNSVYLYILIVFIIVFSANLIAKPIDNTSLVYYLNSPVSRGGFMISNIAVMITSLILLSGTSVVTTILCKIIIVKDTSVDWKYFIMTNVVISVIFLFFASVCMLICAFVKTNGEALAYSSVIIIIEYVLDMIRKVSDKVEIFKYFTVFTIYDAQKIKEDAAIVYIECACLIIASIILFIIGIKIFKKRDLYL